jgi:hypothetical protein
VCSSTALAKKLYLANWASSGTNFHIYDFATAAWSSGPALPVTSHGALTTTGSTVRFYGSDNNVYEYSPVTGAWTKMLVGTPPALGSFIDFEYLNGNMYACAGNTALLYVYTGTTWITVTLPQNCSLAGSVDRAKNEVYLKVYGNAGFMVVSAVTNTVVRNFANPTAIGENTSSAAFLGGSFYERDTTGHIFASDGLTGTRTDTGVDPGGSYSGFVSEPNAGLIYVLSDAAAPMGSFISYKPPTLLSTLTVGGPNEGTLSTITYTY